MKLWIRKLPSTADAPSFHAPRGEGRARTRLSSEEQNERRERLRARQLSARRVGASRVGIWLATVIVASFVASAMSWVVAPLSATVPTVILILATGGIVGEVIHSINQSDDVVSRRFAVPKRPPEDIHVRPVARPARQYRAGRNVRVRRRTAQHPPTADDVANGCFLLAGTFLAVIPLIGLLWMDLWISLALIVGGLVQAGLWHAAATMKVRRGERDTSWHAMLDSWWIGVVWIPITLVCLAMVGVAAGVYPLTAWLIAGLLVIEVWVFLAALTRNRPRPLARPMTPNAAPPLPIRPPRADAP